MARIEKKVVYLSVAANLDPERNILAALRMLAQQVDLLKLSTFYRTKAIGRPEQPDYLNGVARFETMLAPEELKTNVLRAIESRLGRVRTVDTYAARTIDLDILLYADRVLNSSELRIPDPDILSRPFLSAGLLELDPEITLPGNRVPLAEQLDIADNASLQADSSFTRRLKELFAP